MVDRRLGRGLEFFLSDAGSTDRVPPAAPSPPDGGITEIGLSQLTRNPFQPREEFDESELEQLAASIRSSGILQPVLVRKVGEQFQIVAGERRWRAAQKAGLERIPAVVRDLDDETAAVLALVENVQRTDLNAIEKAKAFRQIQTLTKANQAEVAQRVGLERSTVSNLLRLLELPVEVQAMVSRGTLSMGHARALLGLATEEEQKTVADEIVRKKLSVRQVETFVQSLNEATAPPEPGKAKKAPQGRPLWLHEIEETLVEVLGTSVGVRYGRKRSKITIECLGREEFERVYELLRTLGAE